MHKVKYSKMIVTNDNIWLIGSLLLFISVIAGKTGYKFGVPVLLLFLFLGMITGYEGMRQYFYNPLYAQTIGSIALIIILFSGGMSTKYSEIRPILGEGIILATFGVVITALSTSAFVYWLGWLFEPSLGLALMPALLLGAIISPTDSASVFAILRAKNMNMKQHAKPLLELESGSNDPMAYMLTIFFIEAIQTNVLDVCGIITEILLQIMIGGGTGFLFGLLTMYLMNNINIDNRSFYYILLISCVFLTYSFSHDIGGNGFMSVYISGVVIGNNKMIHKRSAELFIDGLTWLFQIIMFISLGILIDLNSLLQVWDTGILVGLFLIIIARPIAVFLCLAPFRKFTLHCRLYLSWIGLRGAVPIILATYPLTSNIPHAQTIFNIVFFITIISLLVQGTTAVSAAKLLKLSSFEHKNKKEFDIELSEDIKSAMSEIYINDTTLINGNKLMNLAMPEHTLVVMLKRNNNYFVPDGTTLLIAGDCLLVISDNEEALIETYRELGIDIYRIKKEG